MPVTATTIRWAFTEPVKNEPTVQRNVRISTTASKILDLLAGRRLRNPGFIVDEILRREAARLQLEGFENALEDIKEDWGQS